ncbi:MAG: hypothetical protein V3T83_14550 [Acidobacteriota bacterium]
MISPGVSSSASSGAISTLSTALEASRKAAASMQRTAHEIARGEVSEKQMVDLMSDHRTYRSNLELIKAADEQVGTILDILG